MLDRHIQESHRAVQCYLCCRRHGQPRNYLQASNVHVRAACVTVASNLIIRIEPNKDAFLRTALRVQIRCLECGRLDPGSSRKWVGFRSLPYDASLRTHAVSGCTHAYSILLHGLFTERRTTLCAHHPLPLPERRLLNPTPTLQPYSAVEAVSTGWMEAVSLPGLKV